MASCNGRPTILTPEIQEHILNCCRLTMPLVKIANMVGVNKETIMCWVRQGEGRAGKKRRRKEPFISFAVAFKRARAEGSARRLARIEQAGRGGQVLARETVTRERVDKATGEKIIETVIKEKFTYPQWQADAWMEERTDPEHFALRERQQMVGLKEEVSELKKVVRGLRKTSPATSPALAARVAAAPAERN